MKKLFILALIFGSVQGLQGQSCNDYFPLKEGSRWVMETFNQKNKFMSRSVQQVSETKSLPGGVFEGHMTGEVIDNKEKSMGTIDYTVKCDGDNFYISMNSMLSPEQMNAYKDMDVEVNGDFIELPSHLEADMSLKDASIEVKVQNSGFPIMTMTIEIYDRKVVGFESVTTPAGTFECVKIGYNARSQMGQAIPIKINFSGAEWYAKGTGLVKTESYDKKDNINGYTLLTEFSD